jgi:hypothetical protein
MDKKIKKLQKYLYNALDEIRDLKKEVSKKIEDSSSSEGEGISLDSDSSSSSSSSFKKDEEEEKEDSFVVEDDEDPSSYSSSLMDALTVKNNNKKLKQKRKRESVQSNFFIKESFEDGDKDDVDIIGEDEDEQDNSKELSEILGAIPKIFNIDDYNRYIASSPWWKKTFGRIFEEILENIGKGAQISSEVYKTIIYNEVIYKVSPDIIVKKYGEIAHEECSFCGYKRHCRYLYEGHNIGGKCFPVVECFVRFFKTLASDEECDLKKLLEIRDDLYKAYENQKKKK